MSAVRAASAPSTLADFIAEVSLPRRRARKCLVRSRGMEPPSTRVDVDFTPAQRVEYQRKLISVLSDNEGMS